MKKRSILAIVVPLLGLSAIVGTGLASWVFNTTSTKDATGSVQLEKVVGGTLDFSTATKTALGITGDTAAAFDVVLGQGGNGENDVTKGISITKTNDKTTTIQSIDVEYKLTADQVAAFQSAEGLSKINFKVEITIGSTLATYIEVKKDASANNVTLHQDLASPATAMTESDTDAVYTYTTEVQKSSVTTDTATQWTLQVKTATDSSSKVNELLQYKAGKKPTDANQAEAMNNAINTDTSDNAKIKIAFSATYA